MQCVLLVRDHPRALALQPYNISHSYDSKLDANLAVLVFENIYENFDPSRPQCNVSLVKESEFDTYEYRQLSSVYGCLGLLQVEKDMFLAAVTSCTHIGEIRPGETLSARITMTAADKYSFDDHFLWNKYMIKELLNFRSKLSKANQEAMDQCGFLVLAIQGYIGRKEVTIKSNTASLSVISKLSCKRAGTRYNTRGIDDDGNVANFVETETILQMSTSCFSYVQIRGSVPVFWEQQGLQVMSHKIQISRGPDATQPANELCGLLGQNKCGPNGALKSEYTRSGKLTWSGVIGDATKTVNRFYINNFQDKSKQEVIDLLLGKLMYQKVIEIHDPVHELVLEDMHKRVNDFSSKSTINIFVGSINLNGCLPSGESLSPWLFAFDSHEPEPDLFVIGFQEIVELIPQQIVSADPEKLRIWEKEISDTLNNRPNKRSSYVILRSGQLVGTALVIYARADIVSNIRNVEYIMKKTGLRGMAGNKGAVAIRLDYHDASMCFVTAHLAAGQTNIEERNRDYKTINDGLLFRNARRLEHHEYVIWLGDFNYRISLSNEEVRSLIEKEDFSRLLEADQLSNQVAFGLAFNDYIEGPITFLPTYKYDDGTNEYDSSEKARVPAWTDRILYRGNKIRQIGYSRAEIMVSDHRPVMSSFDIEVIKYDEVAKERLQRELYLEKLQLVSQKLEDKKVEPAVGVLIDFEDKDNSKEEDLPPPSSETYQWWNSASSSSTSSLVVDKNDIDKEYIVKIKFRYIIDLSANNTNSLPKSVLPKNNRDTNWTPLTPTKIFYFNIMYFK
ncbi:unnamed protein product [Rhizophagus irregularis]|nr:unnamed protein product [Rhizophagus irregularis]